MNSVKSYPPPNKLEYNLKSCEKYNVQILHYSLYSKNIVHFIKPLDFIAEFDYWQNWFEIGNNFIGPIETTKCLFLWELFDKEYYIIYF